MRRVTDEHHRPSVPHRDGWEVVGIVCGKLKRPSSDDPGGRAAVPGKQVDQVPLPLLGGGSVAFRQDDGAAGDVYESDDPAAAVDDVAEERARTEHHILRVD